jgi:hypothetical protein
VKEDTAESLMGATDDRSAPLDGLVNGAIDVAPAKAL